MPMAVTSCSDLLTAARRSGYAVGAFSVHTPEMVEAVLAAAESRQASVILQVGQRAIRQSGLREVCAWVLERATRSTVPVVLHLDHSRDPDQIADAVRAGCTSVMFDGSHLPFTENVAATAAVVRTCHAAGIPVEGELGRIAGAEDGVAVAAAQSHLAEPSEAVRFAEATGVDSLAPAVGSVHGLPPDGAPPPVLDMARLEAIAQAVRIPLVLHGGSGLPVATLRAAISTGVAKVNVDTELRRGLVRALQDALADEAARDDPYAVMARARHMLTEMIGRRIDDFGTSGRAGAPPAPSPAAPARFGT